jgi:thiamine pyrophosphate-dependent acetolactate synthase large subunit-like protein
LELLSGGEMLVRALADEGVEHVFGYPGGAVLHIYDALFQQDKINLIYYYKFRPSRQISINCNL